MKKATKAVASSVSVCVSYALVFTLYDWFNLSTRVLDEPGLPYVLPPLEGDCPLNLVNLFSLSRVVDRSAIRAA